MTTLARRIRKAAGMDLAEWRERGRQVVHAYGERLLGIDQGELRDEALRRRLPPSLRRAPVATAAAEILETMRRNGRRGGFMPVFESPEAAAALLKRRFPRECGELIQRAERAIDGRFDLLGYQDLSFGRPIDWRWEPISGKRTGLSHWSTIDYLNPAVAGDKKVTWELNRHAHFVTLGQAYLLTKQERYAEAVVEQLTGWLEANPPRRGINWASSLEASFRSIAWIWTLHCLAGSPRLTPSVFWRACKSLVQHGSFIESYLSHYFAPNTHLTGEALGLVYLAAAFPWLADAARWRTAGLGILLEQLTRQVRPDGVYFEQSSYYHRYTADFYLHVMVLGRHAGFQVPASAREAVRGLLDHLLWITRPDGRTTMYGDEDGGRLLFLHRRDPADFRDTLQSGAALYGSGIWKWAAGPAGPELLWFLGPQGLSDFDRLSAAPPPRVTRHFKDSGVVILRDGWDGRSSYLFVDGGPHGAANYVHAHADALSFEYAAEGVTWMVDPGTYGYTKEPEWRDFFRSSPGHNTLTIDGLPQSEPDGPFSWRRTADGAIRRCEETDEGSYCEGEQNGYLRLVPPVLHSRAFHLFKRSEHPAAPSSLVIRDRVVTSGSHGYEVRLHLAPGCEPSPRGDGMIVTHPSGGRLAVDVWRLERDQGAATIALTVEAGWVSRCYGQREPAHVLVARARCEGNVAFVTVLRPALFRESTDHDAAPQTAGERCTA
ncbi:MAG TPA: alginate lyase family protein [Nitrospira sp.]|nr:alginate lyase family protein [Nitrospira sp.]